MGYQHEELKIFQGLWVASFPCQGFCQVKEQISQTRPHIIHPTLDIFLSVPDMNSWRFGHFDSVAHFNVNPDTIPSKQVHGYPLVDIEVLRECWAPILSVELQSLSCLPILDQACGVSSQILVKHLLTMFSSSVQGLFPVALHKYKRSLIVSFGKY